MYQVVKRAEEHLMLATEARSYLRSQVEDSKVDIEWALPDDVPPP